MRTRLLAAVHGQRRRSKFRKGSIYIYILKELRDSEVTMSHHISCKDKQEFESGSPRYKSVLLTEYSRMGPDTTYRDVQTKA